LSTLSEIQNSKHSKLQAFFRITDKEYDVHDKKHSSTSMSPCGFS